MVKVWVTRIVVLCLGLLVLSSVSLAAGGDTDAQYPRILLNSYFGIHISDFRYRFSDAQLAPGFHALAIHKPPLGVRVVLFGHEFNKYLSAQVSYMRPVKWVKYDGVNGDNGIHTVWMNIAGLTIKPRLPLTNRISVYGEAGLGIVTRKGFGISGATIVKDELFSTLLWGGGVQYKLNRNWDLIAESVWTPQRAGVAQPATSVASAGFNYTMRAIPDEKVRENSSSTTGRIFPKNLVQAGYATNQLGWGVNRFVTSRALPIFWAGTTEAKRAFSVDYERSVFHTSRVFSVSWGAGVASMTSAKRGEHFTAASFYPVLRFTVLRIKPADFYFNYSLAGPTFISRNTLDGGDLGRRFTFQDFIGLGLFTSRSRRINAEVRISHYSNGNIFPRNAGISVPLGFNAGYTF